MSEQNPKRFMNVSGSRMAYVERGTGRPLLFLHGNPTSSYLWRHVIPPLAASYRCIAPDLIGMGDSDKLAASLGEGRYSLFSHQHYLDGFIEALQLTEPVTLVLHDWGSALGFDWARRFPKRVRGIAYMEAIVAVRKWQDMPELGRTTFQALRSERGEDMILAQNLFVEQMLPRSMLRTLTPEEHEEYRRPFREPGEDRRPTLSWARQLPMDGEPREICELVERYAAFLAGSPIPKLFINAEPGRLLTGPARDACRLWPNQQEVTVKGLHYVQEDCPLEISTALAGWASTLP